MKRLFVAIDIPDEFKREIAQRMPRKEAGCAWTKRDQLHLTLHFLGSTEIERMARLTKRLGKLAFQSFELEFDGCGFFPNERRPKVFWLGFKPSDALLALHAAIADVLRGLEFEPDQRDYVPHLTLARLKRGYRPRKSNSHLIQPFIGMSGSFAVDRFLLFSSDTQASGAVHIVEHEFVTG